MMAVERKALKEKKELEAKKKAEREAEAARKAAAAAEKARLAAKKKAEREAAAEKARLAAKKKAEREAEAARKAAAAAEKARLAAERKARTAEEAARQEARKKQAVAEAAAAEERRLATERKKEELLAAAIANAKLEEEAAGSDSFPGHTSDQGNEDATTNVDPTTLTESELQKGQTLERLQQGEWIIMFPPDTPNPREYRRLFYPDDHSTSTDSSSEDSEVDAYHDLEYVSEDDPDYFASEDEETSTNNESEEDEVSVDDVDDDDCIASFASSAFGSAIGGAVRVLAPIILQHVTAQEEMALTWRLPQALPASPEDEANRTSETLHSRRRWKLVDPSPYSDTDSMLDLGRGERFMSPEEFETMAWKQPQTPSRPPSSSVRRDPMKKWYMWGLTFFAFWYVLGHYYRERQDYMHGPGINPWEDVPRMLRRWQMSSVAGRAMEEKVSSGY
ncbi:hypothetical protein BZA05DRAFT_384332 [Tricharina praecox]|uniref:uncharacterized protein n=1 Tax=Tricharina praecox TaxID=43433 RepID=UPI00221E8FBB|nr:uncharacterized protein BZA05DRAFT_384332 [Tricharina praecox]KAI5857675.1 hypothetical protein BZA05DRAFT_384332 [Tricharina praecox]